MKEIRNRHNYYVRSIFIIILLAALLILPFIIFFPEGLLLGIPAFLVLFRLFIYVNITQHIAVGPEQIIITSYKLFFFRKMIIPSDGVLFRLIPIRSSKGLSHSLEVVKDGRIIYEVFNSEGFSKEDFQILVD